MPDAVLLEWEGVLADTRTRRRAALRRALSAEGVAPDAADDDALDDQGVRDATAAALHSCGLYDETLADLIARRAEQGFADGLAQGIVLAGGASAFMARLQLGSRVAVVTRAGHEETSLFLRLSGLDGAVSTISTADRAGGEGRHRRALAQLRAVRPVDAQRTVSLQSRAEGIACARAAGCRVVAIGTSADVAMDADATASSVEGMTIARLRALAGLAAVGGTR